MAEPVLLHLPERYLLEVKRLLRQHLPQATVLAYGSRVRGDHFEASDLDLAAQFPPSTRPDPFRLSALIEALQDSNLPILVQIVDWDRIPQAFRDEIAAACVELQRGDPGSSAAGETGVSPPAPSLA